MMRSCIQILGKLAQKAPCIWVFSVFDILSTLYYNVEDIKIRKVFNDYAEWQAEFVSASVPGSPE